MVIPAVMCALLAGQPGEPTRVRYQDLPAAAQLGVRAEAIQNAWPSLSTIVIVPDAGAYVRAVAGWTPVLRYPVLIDDGSPAGREDIARFARALAPKRMVRWTGAAVGPDSGARARADAALHKIWANRLPEETGTPKVESSADLIARWKTLSVPRTGIVIASADDAAWPAALALAAGRAQPLAWVDRPPGRVDGAMTPDAIRSLERAVQGACEATGLSWKALGDDIDSVALCMGIPGRIQADSKTILAMTDVLARVEADDKGRVGGGTRWAWAGQVLGTEARSAYTAMCSLFLGPKRAWLFDGYDGGKPWSDFDAGAAADYLKRIALESMVDDAPRAGERVWRLKSSRAVDAGLIGVNSKGASYEFFLEPGRCVPGDVPFAGVPFMLYFVHSWSAVSPLDRSTVGGRWLERGAYAYLGSVDEPYLQAFVPTPIAMGRLASKYPFAAAVRPDNGHAWKLTTIGDPLTMLGPPARRVDGDLPLDGAVDVQEGVRTALEGKDYAGAIRGLSLQGRDADVAALIRGVLKEDEAALTPEGAEDAILPLFRADEYELLTRVYARLPETAARRPDLRDALWLGAYRVLPGTRDSALVSLLRQNIREDVRCRDTLDLAPAFAAVFGASGAVGMLEETKSRVRDEHERKQLDEAIRANSPGRSR